MAVKPGNSSIFVGKKEFEIMKKPGRGTHGHIAILTNNVDRAIYHLSQRGVKFDMDSKNVKDGKTIAIYFADEVAASPSTWFRNNLLPLCSRFAPDGAVYLQ